VDLQRSTSEIGVDRVTCSCHLWLLGGAVNKSCNCSVWLLLLLLILLLT
jgi:hypothetical protein